VTSCRGHRKDEVTENSWEQTEDRKSEQASRRRWHLIDQSRMRESTNQRDPEKRLCEQGQLTLCPEVD
jgi:hypothetical protein